MADLGARLGSVRTRTTLAATTVVGLALGIAAFALLVLLERSLVENVDDVAGVRAEDIASLARADRLPSPLPVGTDDGSAAQVVDASGRVVAATPGLERRPRMATFLPPANDVVARTVDPFGDGDVRVVAMRTTTPDGPVIIYVAASLEPVRDPLGLMRHSLLVGAPLLILLVAGTTWVVTGRALRPVEAIRAEVAEIGDRALDRRVPVPPSGDEIARLAGTMNAMLDRIEQAAARQRRFVADASHELHTPLAAARLDLEVALSHPESVQWEVVASDLLAANGRMERLVRDLLFLARSDDSVRPTPPSPVDLDVVVHEEVAARRPPNGVRIDVDAVEPASVLGRRDELARVVRNLVDNATRYADERVVVELRTDDGEVVLVVADDGPGIPEHARERVFERFTRLDDARTRETGGAGLGLAIVREIVSGHGGHVHVDERSSGARLVVRLRAL